MSQVAPSHSTAGPPDPSVRLPPSSCCSPGQSAMLTPCGLLRNITFAYTSILCSTESASWKPAAPPQQRDDAKTGVHGLLPTLLCHSPHRVKPGFQGLLAQTPRARLFLQRQVVFLSPHILLTPSYAKQDKALCRVKTRLWTAVKTGAGLFPALERGAILNWGNCNWPYPSYGERCRIELGVVSMQNKVPTFHKLANRCDKF